MENKNQNNISLSRELEESKKETKKRYYIAYGSNMDICRMEKRCPDFEYVGVGYIYNYRLTFQQSISGFYANLILNKSKKNFEYTPVIIYLITEQDEESLDFYEGYPQAYKKKEIEVELEDGDKINGLAYVLPANREYGIPTNKYYRMISNAYKIYGFEFEVLKNALVYSYKRAKMNLNAEFKKTIKVYSNKTEEKNFQKEKENFIKEFNEKNNSTWVIKEEGGSMVLQNTQEKKKVFEVILNKDKSIIIKDRDSGLPTTLADMDTLIKCCSTVK